MSSTINQYIIISDTHCGDRFGLYPLKPVVMDGGGKYTPSKLQKKVCRIWENEFWNEWVPTVTRGERYGVVFNGDAMEGRHHHSISQITQNLADQRRIAQILLEPVVELCDHNFLFVRGTEAHTGSSGENEEILADSLGAIPDSNGMKARYELWLQVGRHLAYIKHYIGVTSRGNNELSALNSEYWNALSEAARWGRKFPDFCVFSHRHRHSEMKIPTAHGDGICVVTPGWQLITPFVYRLSGNPTAQIGGVLLRSGDEEHFTRHFTRSLEGPKAVKLYV